ncbi:MAG: extracellular solute-binding protein [Sphaerochaetaceae bacterium]|nr:extracellular solute-binding protein [Sphaerochaetaceae bacterium]
MKKTLLVAVLLVGVLMSVFCAGASETTPAAAKKTTSTVKEAFQVPEGGYDGSAVTVKFYHTMGSNLSTVLDDYIVEFNKLYPNIKIEWEAIGSYDDVRDQISTQIFVGSQPNMAYCYPDHVALYNMAGAVATLDNLINSTVEVKRADGSVEILGLTDAQKADFIEGYYNEGKQFGDGLMYTMPLSKSTEVLYYNKTFFDANNIPVPTTWEEMEKTCAMIKAIDPNSIPLGYDSEANWFITMCEQYNSPYTSATGDHFLFNNDQNKAFMKMFRDWYTKGYLTTQKLYGAYTSGLFTSTSGITSYMSIGSSAGASYQRPTANADGSYPFEVGITTIPQVSSTNRKVISQGPSLCIFDKANPMEVVASWLFVKYLTTTVEFQAEFSMVSGYVPVIKSVAENEIYADFLASADGGANVTALSAKVCLEQEDAYYTSPAFNGSSTARDQVGALLAKCLTLKTDAEINTAFADAVDECEYAN